MQKSARNAYVVLVTLSVAVMPRAAFAYIDPGTGHLLVQAMIGGIAAIGVMLIGWRTRLSNWLRGRRHTNRLTDSSQEHEAIDQSKKD